MNLKKSQSGNVLIYILIGVVLFAALTYALTKQDGGNAGGSALTKDRAALKAQELIQYATTSRAVVEQMRAMLNVLPTEFSFAKQGDAGYGTGSNITKVYHPAGGGLNVFVPAPEMFASSSSMRGWVSQQGTNVAWTPSTASDIIFTFMDLSQLMCESINDRLYKDKSIPTIALSADVAFINGGGDDADFTTASCSQCNGKPSYCVRDSGGAYAFYNVILSR